MKEKLEIAVRAWLRELQDPTPAPERIAEAAKQVAQYAAGSAEMRRLVGAIRSDIEDHIDCTVCQERLPQFIAAGIGGETQALGTAAMTEVRDHLSLCPYCTAAYAQVSEWMSIGEVGALPAQSSYPDFDLLVSSLPESTPQPSVAKSSFADLLHAVAAQGKRWTEDARGRVYLLFDLEPQTAAWAVKSGEAGRMLAQTVVSDEEITGWEVEASAFASDAEDGPCSIEVAIYHSGSSGSTLAGIPVALVSLDEGTTFAAQWTDAAGIAEFKDIPLERLARTAVQIGLQQ